MFFEIYNDSIKTYAGKILRKECLLALLTQTWRNRIHAMKISNLYIFSFRINFQGLGYSKN